MTETATVTLPDGREAEVSGATREAVLARVEALRLESVPRTQIDVNTTPIELPPKAEEQTFGVEGGIIPPFKVTPEPFTPYERDAAARGVDIDNELKDKDLRKAIGFSAGQPFTVDFLSRKIAERTGLPQDQVIQIAPTGQIEFYNPETKRFTPVDSKNVTTADLSDMYGPATAISPPVAFGTLGMFGGFWGSASFGAAGAFLGEISRLQYGRHLGVHDLDDEAMLMEGFKSAGIDAAAAGGGYAVGTLWKLGKRLLRAEAVTPRQAESILDEMGKYEDEIRLINESLEGQQRSAKFVLDPVADAESVIGLELRSSAESGLGGPGRAQRAAEVKANESALEDFARIVNRVEAPEGQIFTNEGADAIAAPAQQQLREIEASVQGIYDRGVVAAERDAMQALDELGTLTMAQSKAAGGLRARAAVAAHADELDTIKNADYDAYARNIGQKLRGDAGFDEATKYSSNIQVTVDAPYVAHVNASRKLIKDSVITTEVQGAKTLKPLKVGDTIDLAVLDDNLKQLRAVERKGTGDFTSRKLREAERQLTRMRADYLKKNHPEALDLLTKAEGSMTRYKDFVDKSVFKKVLAQDSAGRYRVDDVGVFKAIFLADDGGEAMRALVNIAEKEPGAIFGIQDAVLQFYKNYVVPPGAKIMTKQKHDVFVDRYADQLSAVFPGGPAGTSQMQKFGNLEAAVATQRKQATDVANMQKTNELWKLGHGRPEKMGAATFGNNLSNREIRRALYALQQKPAALAAYRDSVGREVYHKITSKGALNDTSIYNLLESDGGKLAIIFGETYVPNMKALARLIHANRLTVTGPALKQDTLIGRAARALISPPLTRKGRAQTFVEKLRTDAAHKMIASAVRDADVLRAIVSNANRDIHNTGVLNILAQTEAMALMYDDTLEAN
jgi:hypothetical protein